MKKILQFAALFFCAIATFAQQGNQSIPAAGSSSGGASTGTIGQPFIVSTFPGYGTTKLIGLYLFNDGSGTTLKDWSGNGNNASVGICTAPFWYNSSFTGAIGNSFSSGNCWQLPSKMNSARGFSAAVSIQEPTGNRNCIAPIINNGNGSANGRQTGIVLQGAQGNFGVHHIYGGVGTTGGVGSTYWDTFAGFGTMGYAIDATADYANINGLLPSFLTGTGATLTLIANAGQYQIGGDAVGGTTLCTAATTWWPGGIYGIAVFGTEPTNSDLAGASVWFMDWMNRNNVTGSTTPILSSQAPVVGSLSYPNTDGVGVIVGDSINYGTIGSTTAWATRIIPTAIYGAGNFYKQNISTQIGHKCNDIVPALAGQIAGVFPIAPTGAASNVGTSGTVLFNNCGVNDLSSATSTAAQIANYHVQAAAIAHKYGYKYIAQTVLNITSSNIETNRNLANNLVRGLCCVSNGGGPLDGLADVSANANIGISGACVSGVKFCQADLVHWNQYAIDNVQAPINQGVWDYINGNHSWSTATIYTTGNAAASTVTSVTSAGAGSTASWVFTSPIANLTAGRMIACTGISPTNYNGIFYVLSTADTSHAVTTIDTASNGASFGTCALESDQIYADADTVLNNAGAQTLKMIDAIGMTNQVFCYQNIGAGTWTLQPVQAFTANGFSMNSAQTITSLAGGNAASNFALAAGNTACFVSKLVSAIAGGNNWFQVP